MQYVPASWQGWPKRLGIEVELNSPPVTVAGPTRRQPLFKQSPFGMTAPTSGRIKSRHRHENRYALYLE